jgi:hypothetical protein
LKEAKITPPSYKDAFRENLFLMENFFNEITLISEFVQGNIFPA